MVHRLLLVLMAGLLLLAVACETEPEEPVDEEEDVEAVEDEPDEDYSVDDQPADAAVSFVEPSDGDTVSSPVEVAFEVEGIDLVEAGAPAVGEGHLHVMVDAGCFDDGEVMPGPSDEAEEDGIYHLGDGSDSREIELEPGTYDLCAQIGDGVHFAFGETDEIQITVE